MKTFVFSDTHFTKKFEPKKFDKLAKLINESDRVIINGDFWDGLIITFDEFINSDWQKLFPILKSKKTIYIYGNHDDKSYSDERIYQFCDEAVENYPLVQGTNKYYFTHGQAFLTPKQPKPKPYEKVRKKSYLAFEIIAYKLQGIIIALLGPHAYPKSFNKMTLDQRKTYAPIDSLLVCGHSHTPQHNKELNFLDLGFFNYGWANYMVVEENGKFEFLSEKY